MQDKMICIRLDSETNTRFRVKLVEEQETIQDKLSKFIKDYIDEQ